jgi:uncharacterized Zn-binding protein involved in type VI secretion
MGVSIARIGDKTTGHGCHPPQTIIQGSPNVFLNGLAVARVGDSVSAHTCGSNTHDGVINSGGSNIFVNGQEIALIGSPVSCGGAVAQGSSDTVGA